MTVFIGLLIDKTSCDNYSLTWGTLAKIDDYWDTLPIYWDVVS